MPNKDLIFTLLKLIPNDLKVSDNSPPDEKLSFILDEYETFIEEGFTLPKLCEEMTFLEIKKALTTLPMENKLEFVSKYEENFGRGVRTKEAEERKFKLIKYLVIYGLTLITFLTVISVIYGIVFHSLVVESLLTSIISFLEKMFGYLLPPQGY